MFKQLIDTRLYFLYSRYLFPRVARVTTTGIIINVFSTRHVNACYGYDTIVKKMF